MLAVLHIMNANTSRDNWEDLDVSIAAGNIVSNALQLTRNLFCPFCAEAYMFEFTLKEHLKKAHHNLLTKQLTTQRNADEPMNGSFMSANQHLLHNCPFCGAAFVQFVLIPRHILTYHGADIYNLWKRQDGNIAKVEAAKENEPPIKFATSSSGMTDFFDELSTTTDGCSSNSCTEPMQMEGVDQIAAIAESLVGSAHKTQPAPKSILKKTPNKSTRIICSPSSAAIRRSKSDVVKRSVSCRRELRFDPSTKKSPTLSLVAKVSPKQQKKRNGKLLQFVSMFYRKKGKSATNATNNIVTSTPITFLDDNDDDDDDDPIFSRRKTWKSTRRQNRPLFFDSERFQCAFCRKTWESNDDLLAHLSGHHRGVKQWLRPQYRCSLCGATFYHNAYLIKHSQLQHTPANNRYGAAR